MLCESLMCRWSCDRVKKPTGSPFPFLPSLPSSLLPLPSSSPSPSFPSLPSPLTAEPVEVSFDSFLYSVNSSFEACINLETVNPMVSLGARMIDILVFSQDREARGEERLATALVGRASYAL